jgi:hypothetical protein
MTDQPTSPYPAIILTHLRAFGEQEKQFARSVEFFRAHGLTDIFERYPDVDALAYQICGDAFSTEVKGDFAGVIVAGDRDDAHPASREAKRLIDALALAAEALWTEDCLDLAVLARRTDENVEITVHDPSDDPTSRLLELVEDGEPIPAGYTQDREGTGKLPAGRIVLSDDDIGALAAGRSINVPAGPRGEQIAVLGEDFDEAAIAVLRSGGACDIDGFGFVAKRPAPTIESDGGEEPAGGR